MLGKVVQPNAATVYPLSLEDFGKGLWQSSTKLLVLYEGVCNNALNLQFISQLNLVSQFLASGGRVILLLNNSAKIDHRQESSALWTIVSTANSGQHFVGKPDSAIWSWKCVEDKTGRHHLLIGGAVQSIDSSATYQLVIVSEDAVDESKGRVLKEALNLTGVSISCDATNSSTITTCLGESLSSKSLYCMPLLTEYQVPGEVESLPDGFCWRDYSSTLQTRQLGRVPVWAESMESSWCLVEKLLGSLPPHSGLLVTSSLQESGKGRGSNRWITPLGQAAFTFHLTVDGSSSNSSVFGNNSQSELMKLVVCSQHVVSLAIVLTCRRLIGEHLGLLPADASTLDEETVLNVSYQGPQIRIKWPNDVYVVDSEVGETNSDKVLEHSHLRVLGKLAGVITKGSTAGPERTDLLVGCGVNIANRAPTVCLLDVIDQCRTGAPGHPPELSIARVIAVFLNQLEHLIDRIRRSPTGLSWALTMYTQCWLHSGQVVEVVPSSKKEEKEEASVEPCRCLITGLDGFGFLQVKDLRDGSVYSLHPDGNSMDMMRGLIRPK